jgi:putative ABC transport system ATP-binding protein
MARRAWPCQQAELVIERSENLLHSLAMDKSQGRVGNRSNEPLLVVQHLGRRRPDSNGWLLSDVGLAISPGECIGFVGPTGAGKTLLLRAIALLDPIDTGIVLWQGRAVGPTQVTAYRSRVMYLHQRPSLMSGTVEANLRLSLTLRIHERKQFDLENTVQRLGDLGRDGRFLSRDQKDLSGGERQLVALLRVLNLDPAVLLLDEPTASMDAKSALVVERWIATWMSDLPAQRAVVWVSHDDEQVGRMATRVLRINQGCVIANEE